MVHVHRIKRPTALAKLIAGIVSLTAVAACSGEQELAKPEMPVAQTATPVAQAVTKQASTTKPPSTTNPTSTTKPTSTTRPAGPVPTFVDANGFNDHTVPKVATEAELLALGRSGLDGQTTIKFVMLDTDKRSGPTYLFDSNFYRLHDEWYWFRLLNGQPVPSATDEPVLGNTFTSIDQIYQWAKKQPTLPLDLAWSQDRLASVKFYDVALKFKPRIMGVGSLVRFEPRTKNDRAHWLLEYEYADETTPEWVATFFTRLSGVLPKNVYDQLEWVVRSPQQEQFAKQMRSQKLPFHERIIRYSDIIPNGTVAVYSDGITAGRLRYVGPDDEQDKDMSKVEAGDIVITEHVPDWLPPANAFITSDPQTPLAHVNLLARNRGIPNASLAGIHLNSGLRRAADVRAPALVVARDNKLTVALISEAQFRTYRDSLTADVPIVSVSPVNTATMPLVVDLTTLGKEVIKKGNRQADIDRWRPILGGKSTGFLSLVATPGITPPPTPQAITVKPYIEHVASLKATIAATLSNPDFQRSARARLLLLEGPKSYAKRFPTEADNKFAAQVTEDNRFDAELSKVLRAGGIQKLIESKPVDRTTLASITKELERQYSAYDTETGLRFRSSSSVEDIEGFNGAGLYTSFTGYLKPQLLRDPKDQDKTIERAVLKAWASYWGAEAFEERRLEGIDHLSGAMGLTVHAKFDDELERSNGVATFTYLPKKSGGPSDATLEINVQLGATPVTNPDPQATDLPEVIRVSKRNGKLSVERISKSTLAKDVAVINDAEAKELFAQTESIAQRWRARVNSSLSSAQKLQTVVLDYEFKFMKAGWPKVNGAPFPARLVVRQVRSLDPGMRKLPGTLRLLPVPRDVIMRAALVERVTCGGGFDGTSWVEVRTDTLRPPDMGYRTVPFVSGAARPNSTGCSRVVLHASQDQKLLQVLSDPNTFVMVG